MPSQRAVKVIIDTNILISFLIGKELQGLKDYIVSESIKVIVSDQLFEEIKLVTSREKLRKYFDPDTVVDFLALLKVISKKVRIKKVEPICRDPKDDFLLALAKESKSDFLVTGDKDLLEINVYGKTKIITVRDFTNRMNKLKLNPEL